MIPAGLILSAGESRRMNSPKALLDLGGETFLDRIIVTLAEHCSPVVVVLGHEPEMIRGGLRHAGEARFVVNPDYRLGQLTSMQCGLRALPPDCDRVMFTLVDHPAVERRTVRELLDAQPAPLVIPRHEGRRGHPVLISRDLFAEFLALPPESRASEVIDRHAVDIRYVDVSDPGVLDNVDDAPAYGRLRERLAVS